MRFRPLLLALLTLLASAAPAQTADELLASAETAWRHNLPDIARNHFQRALDLPGTSPNQQALARLGLARALLHLPDLPNARQSLAAFPPNADPVLGLHKRLLDIQITLLDNNPAEALALLESLPPVPPALTPLKTQLHAETLHALGQTPEAVTLLREQLALTPDPALQARLARLLEHQNLPAEALTLWQELAAGEPRLRHTQEAILHLARHALAQNDLQTARSLITPLIESGSIPPALETQLYPLWIEALEAAEQYTEAAETLLAWENILPPVADPLPLRLRRARNLIAAGTPEPAETLLRQLIATRGDQPALADAWLHYAQTLQTAGQLPQALEAYQTYLAAFTDPDGILQATLRLAALHETKGDLPEAQRLLERAWTLAPPSSPLRPELLLKWADTFLARNDLPAARERYEQFLTLFGPDHPLAPRARFQAALCLARTETLDQALRELTRLRLEHPQHPVAERALLQQAVLLVRFLRLEQALGLFDAYLDQYPDGQFVPDALTDKGIAAYRLGFFELALLQFETVLRDFPGHPRAEQAFFMRGWALYLLENVDEALQVGRTFLETYPDSPFAPDVRFWLGEHAFNRGQFDQAAETFLLIANSAPTPSTQSKARYLAGRAAMGQGQFQTAVEHFSKALELLPDAPHSPEALFHQGDALTELNRFDDAILVFEHLIQRHPATTLALAAKGRIGDCHFTLGERQDPARLQQALSAYRLVEESSGAPLNLRFQALYKTALTLQTLGRTDDALSQYLLVLHRFRQDRPRLDPESAAYYFNRAATSASQIYEQRREWRSAIQIYREIIDAGLQPAAREAEERIQNLRREHRILF